jgi:hypothetical protein
MPILPPRLAADSYGPLARTARVALVALEKRRRKLELRAEESSALERLAHDLEELSRVSALNVKELGSSPSLERGVYALVAIEETDSECGAKQYLSASQTLRQTLSGWDPQMRDIEAAQAVCVSLLQHLERLRPGIVAP